MFTRMFVSFNEKILEASNQLFQNFKSNGKTADKQLKYFMHEYKKVSNLEKLYPFPKIDKALYNVPGWPVVSNCVTSTVKASEF